MSFVSIITTKLREERRSAFLLCIVLSLLLLLWPVAFTQPPRFILRIAVCNLLLIASAAAIYRTLAGKAISLVICAFLSLNFAIDFSTYSIYQSEFNVAFAMSILTTHLREVKSMAGIYLYYMPVAVAHFAITLTAIHLLSKKLTRKQSILSFALLAIFIAWFSFACWFKKQKDKEVYYPLASRILVNTPFYVASDFIIANRDNQLSAKISLGGQNDAHLTWQDQNIETYVVVIGESARRNNMQLYGFSLDTTPVETKLNHNALIFEHAIAPASATVLAVPMILSRADAEHFTIDNLSDNIVNAANRTGFNTYWISAQGNSGKSNNYVAAIASTSHHLNWVESHYDDELLPWFDDALKQHGKKVIFLHINGSHELACTRYPKSHDYYHTGNKYEDCYNNAIRFTDYFLGEVMARLANRSASLLYFSDHGLEKNAELESIYMHGARFPSKEAYDVPQFIWYSDKALGSQPRNTGKVEAPWSTANNYFLMLSWMGISTAEKNCRSILDVCFHPDKTFPVMDGGRNIFEYQTLRTHFNDLKPEIAVKEAGKNSL